MKTFLAPARLTAVEEKENIHLSYALHHLFSKYSPVSKSVILYGLFPVLSSAAVLATYSHRTLEIWLVQAGKCFVSIKYMPDFKDFAKNNVK